MCVTQQAVVKFIKEKIIFRHGLPEIIVTDQGTMFTGAEVVKFAESLGIRLSRSTPYYPQSNGQAEATNKVLINNIKKAIEDNPRRWHEVLEEVLWANRISKRSAEECKGPLMEWVMG